MIVIAASMEEGWEKESRKIQSTGCAPKCWAEVAVMKHGGLTTWVEGWRCNEEKTAWKDNSYFCCCFCSDNININSLSLKS